ncbi:hypothetical protein TSUD_379300 [Trifolium subterraneum]|uniref:Uncharacterized protein n=1 Tax=Trifolium subterraneum TaxID=3900 RepID=A0A2Z6P018_TRISU|nr:hypothetical protein TSUD_379300 [Trifolium subterraneum]
MTMAESVDFVHVYDVVSGFENRQEIDFFGKTSEISFSPSTRSFFVGISPCPNQDTSFITYNIIPGVLQGGGGHEPKDDDEEFPDSGISVKPQ